MEPPRGEPDYTDHVPRLQAWKRAHPDAEVVYIRPHWQAAVPGDGNSETIVTRMSLGQLMNKLESL